MNNSENNKRIFENTILLYFRMLITMGVQLYTSRVVLITLGVEDFGIYNIIGGIIVLISFLNTAMASATQRFLNYEMGLGENAKVGRIFSMSMTIHICIAILVIILAETIGLWFLNTQLNIPEHRMNAANWVYQFTILAFCIQIIRVPYNASIIAYEKMSFFAYISILEVTLKLLIVFLLLFFGFDKLILYAILTASVMFIVLIIYKIYCNIVFTTCRYNFFWDASLYKKLISFTGWSLLGSLTNVGAQQGLNILLNIFYGVTVNAAMGIANQVSSSVYGFISNFQTAFNPQIVKSYASNDRLYFLDLIFLSSKFSYFLMLLFSLPVLICTNFIFQIWLHNVPEYAVLFSRLMILYLLIDAIQAPLWMSVRATGKIRNYEILMASIILLNLPLAYFLLKLDFPPSIVLFVRIIINLLAYMVRIMFIRPLINLPALRYIKEVLLVAFLVTLLSLPLPIIINSYVDKLYGLIATTIISLLSTGLCIYTIGLKKDERRFLNALIMSKIKKQKV